ncbi:hypothetical protein BGW38_009250 [Lunasporangiospora selenospora]|uniref:Uncharacterized protein n=1 Tax=Lunasporangiospora selenospora TaxID=979761 RepID=A0A9P6K8Q6_9FUNG|nr:hypothetical protein BGW38_009250 [Lunasporangiospora selenospora]
MQHRFQSPSQRPPQLWDEEPEAIEMDEYQRQQMETIESKMKKQTLIQEHVWGLYAIRMHHLKRLRKKELIQMDFFLRREDPEVSIKEDLEDMIAALKKKEEEKAKELDGTPAEEEEGQEEEDQEEEEEDQEAEEVDEADEEVQAPTEPVAEEVKID